MRGKVHEYFPLTLDCTTRGVVKIDMKNYVKNVIDEFSINIEKAQVVTSPATKKLFNMDVSNPLNKNKVELFHTTVDRSLVL